MYELFSAFFQILTSFSLKPLTRNHSYIMVYYVFLIRVCDDHSATWHFYYSWFLKVHIFKCWWIYTVNDLIAAPGGAILCRICIYMPYIRVHKLFYFIYYRLIMQCFISIIYCHYYSFIGIPLYPRINQCVSVIPASQITNKQKRLLIYSELHWNHLMCTVKAYQMQQVNVSKLNENFNCTCVNQQEVSDFRTCSVAYIGFSRAQTWATLITSFISSFYIVLMDIHWHC